MASIVTTVRHHHPRDGGRVSPAVSADCVLAIQRVFRGYRVRKQRLREEHLIDPSSLLGTLDRHNRERKGFCSLLSYTLYLLLFVLLVLSRSNSLSRFHMESAFVSAIGGVSTASGKDLYGVTSEDDVYEFVEAMLLQFYSVGAGEVVLGMDPNATRTDLAMQDAFEELAAPVAQSRGFGSVDDLPPPEKQAVFERAHALLGEFREPESEVGFSCDQTLREAGKPMVPGLVVPPEVLAGWTLATEREYSTGNRFPTLEHGGGEFLMYSRLTGAMLLSMTRRTRTDCDLGKHSNVFDTCYHDSDADDTEFVGPWTGTTYRVNENGGRYYSLFDLGTFGFGLRTGQCILESLNRDGWIGPHTKEVTLSLSAINGNVRLLTDAQITFEFTLGGAVVSGLVVSSTTIPSHEIGLWTATQFILVLLFSIVTVIKLAAAVAEACTSKLSGWLLVDVLLYITFLAAEVLYVVLASSTAALESKTPDEIMDADDPFRILVDQALQVENIVTLEQAFKLLTSTLYLLALLRLLRAFQFHDRLNVITRTLTVAAGDLVHFLIIFLSVTCLYSSVAVTVFGSQLNDFHTFPIAFETFMRVLLGDFAYAELVLVAPIMGPIVFWSFVFVVFFVLLNVFLSIIVDSYILVKEEAGDSDSFFASLWGTLEPPLVRFGYRIKFLCQSCKCTRFLVHEPLPPAAARAMSMRWGGQFKVQPVTDSPPRDGALGAHDDGQVQRTPSGRERAADAQHMSQSHAAEMGRLSLSQRTSSKRRHKATGKPYEPVFGALFAPPRATELAVALRKLGEEGERRSSAERVSYIRRVDVRKAIGLLFDKDTLDNIMTTFGRVLDPRKAEVHSAAAIRSNRTRVLQKSVLRQLHRINQKLDTAMRESHEHRLPSDVSESLRHIASAASNGAFAANPATHASHAPLGAVVDPAGGVGVASSAAMHGSDHK